MRLTPHDTCTAHYNVCLTTPSGQYKSLTFSVRKNTNCQFPFCLSISLTKVKHTLILRLRSSWCDIKEYGTGEKVNDWHCSPQRALTFLWKCISSSSQSPALCGGGWVERTSRSPRIIHQYPLEKRLGIPQSRFWRSGVKKNFRPLR